VNRSDVRGAFRVIGQVRGLAAQPAGSTCACGEAIAAASSTKPAAIMPPATESSRVSSRGFLGWLAQPVGAAVARASTRVTSYPLATADTKVVAEVSAAGPMQIGYGLASHRYPGP